MKLAKFSLLIVCAVLFTNCEQADPVEEIEKEQEDPKPDPEEPKEITYFTYKAPAYSDTSESDDWVIIHDQDGKLLDYSALEKEDVLVFKKMDTALTNIENLTITTFTARSTETSNAHTLNTHPLVPVGAIWNKEIETDGFHEENFKDFQLRNHTSTPEEKNNTKKSTHNILVNNIPGIEKYNITSAVTGYVIADFSPTDGEDLSLENINLSEGVNYIFFIADSQGSLKHLFFEIDENTQGLIFDYTDFKDFQHILETQLPDNSNLFAVSRGFETISAENRGFEMTIESEYDNPNVSRIGYADGFESYTTSFQLSMTSGYGYRYYEHSVEPLNELTILPKPTFSILDKTPYAYEFETDMAYISGTTSWKYEENFPDGTYVYSYWNIYIPDTKALSIGQLPEELITTHPKLSLEQLKHGDTHLTIRGFDYTQLLENRTKPSGYQYPKITESIFLNTIED